MDAAELVDDSKVIIQCIDPSNVLESFGSAFAKRIPLRNLHWKSPTRPLRSIPILNVNLVGDDQGSDGQGHISRRHQIPGLRQTPYVKLFLLRCDDKETYKEKWRKELKQWVKSNAPPGEGKSSHRGQEKHDACEYLILHVVVPGTTAATQPRSSKGLPADIGESTESLNNKGKWTGKTSATIYDRLKADFDSSSKSTLTRVGQIRLVEAGARPSVLSAAELEEQWLEFVESLKACILASFDARVAQYEEDIRERETHRNRPGWNFCTFFVLKEGLATAFESVGLFDDAMGVYDELSLGLDGAVQEQTDPDNHNHVVEFLPFAKELKALIREAIDPSPNEDPNSSNSDAPLDMQYLLRADKDRYPFDLKRQTYYQQILASDVSVLNFRIYIFTRQMEIYLRSNRKARSAPSSVKTARDDVTLVAELTERAITFISLASRSLKSDLLRAWGGQEGLEQEQAQTQHVVTGNIAANWTWCAMMQILDLAAQTLGLAAVAAMEDPDSFKDDLTSTAPQTSVEPIGVTTSLHATPRIGSPRKKLSQDGFSIRSSVLSMTDSLAGSDVINISRPGSLQLSQSMASLLIAIRRVFENMPSCQTWFSRVNDLTFEGSQVRLMNGTAHSQHVRSTSVLTEDGVEVTAGLASPVLCRLVESFDDCVHLYRTLSIVACRLFDAAESNASAEQLLVDLALMEYRGENYDMASFYLQKVPLLLSGQGLYSRTGQVVGLLADCLLKQGQYTEYASSVVSYLSFMSNTFPLSLPKNFWKNKGQRSCDDLIEHAGQIRPTTLLFSHIFEFTIDDHAVSHVSYKDGFRFRMKLRCKFPVVLSEPDEVTLLLVAEAEQEPNEIQMVAVQTTKLHERWTEYKLESSTTTTGHYRLEMLRLIYGNLTFEHDFRSPLNDQGAFPTIVRAKVDASRPIFVYPRYQSLQVRAFAAPQVHLASARRIAVEMKTGNNHVGECKILVKVATAGVRLHVHEATGRNGEEVIKPVVTRRHNGSVYHFAELPQSTDITLEIPYLLENRNEGLISLRIEVDFSTEHGEFSSYFFKTVNIILPITVNVTDHFRNGYMYSCFTFSPATLVPLQLIDCAIEDHELVEVTGETMLSMPVIVFPKQPFSWMVKFRDSQPRESASGSSRLTLVVRFRCLDEVILSSLDYEINREMGSTPLARYTSLFSNHLRNRYQNSWTEQDLETIGLLHEIEVWKNDDLGWNGTLAAVESNQQEAVNIWLQEWHGRGRTIGLTTSQAPIRQLKLVVELASAPVLIVTSLRISTSTSKSSVVSLGQPISTTMTIQLCNGEDHTAAETQRAREMFYEVVAAPEMWLIGGPRKGGIDLSHGTVEITLILIPQRLGQLLLPQIHVRGKSSHGGGTPSQTDMADPGFEIHHKSQARSVYVVADVQSTIVEVPEDQDADGTHVLVQSNRREGDDAG